MPPPKSGLKVSITLIFLKVHDTFVFLLHFNSIFSQNNYSVIYEADSKGEVISGNLEELVAVSYTHLRAHETRHDLVCRLLLEKKK